MPFSRLSWYALGSIVGCGLIIGAPFLDMVSFDMDSAMLRSQPTMLPQTQLYLRQARKVH